MHPSSGPPAPVRAACRHRPRGPDQSPFSEKLSAYRDNLMVTSEPLP